MVFNGTFNNISAISGRSVLLVEKPGVPGENHRPATSHWQTLSHNVVSSNPTLSWGRTHNVSGDSKEVAYLPVGPKNPVPWHSSINVNAP